MRRLRVSLVAALVHFWEHDGSFGALLGFMVLTIFVFVPLSMDSRPWRVVVDLSTGLLTIAGTYAAWKQNVARSLNVTLAVSSLLALVVGRWFLHESMALLSTALFGLYMLVLTVVVLARVFKPGPVSRYKLEGAIAAYILMGLTAGFTFEFIQRLHPGAFHLQQDSFLIDVLRPQLVYFSYSTLTSVGYGDIYPTIPITRSLASLEAIVGQLYIAILIGGLVSQHLSAVERAERQARREEMRDKRARRRGRGDRENGGARPKERDRRPPPASPAETNASQ